MDAKELTRAILQAVRKPEHPAGVLIESVLEKELGKYENLLDEIKEVLEPSYSDDYAEINQLVRKIEEIRNG